MDTSKKTTITDSRAIYTPPQVIRISTLRQSKGIIVQETPAFCTSGSGNEVGCQTGNSAGHYCWNGNNAGDECNTGSNGTLF